jgi:hypothetical protein
VLSQDPYYFGSIRKVVVAFGSLFSDLHIVRQDLNGSPSQTLKVPLSYGPKDKFLIRIKQNAMPNENDQVEMVLPRMSYEIRAFSYDDARKLASTGRTTRSAPNQSRLSQLNPVPYNITFELNIMVKSIEDGLMIIEQILPNFTPDYTVTVNDIPDLDLKKDIPIVFQGMQTEDTWDGDFKERRTITYTLNFVAKAYIYPPITSGKIILDARTSLYTTGTHADLSVRDVVNPITASKEDQHTIDETITP